MVLLVRDVPAMRRLRGKRNKVSFKRTNIEFS
jgi:hypothetical protein